MVLCVEHSGLAGYKLNPNKAWEIPKENDSWSYLIPDVVIGLIINSSLFSIEK